MKYCVLFLSALFLLASCDKVEQEDSKEDALRDGRWKMASWSKKYRDADGKEKVDNALESVQECRKDDYLIFKKSFQGELNTGENKCPQGEANEITFNWGLSNDDKEMYIYNALEMFNQDVNAEVINFGNTSFTIRYLDIQQTSALTRDTITYTATFRKF